MLTKKENSHEVKCIVTRLSITTHPLEVKISADSDGPTRKLLDYASKKTTYCISDDGSINELFCDGGAIFKVSANLDEVAAIPIEEFVVPVMECLSSDSILLDSLTINQRMRIFPFIKKYDFGVIQNNTPTQMMEELHEWRNEDYSKMLKDFILGSKYYNDDLNPTSLTKSLSVVGKSMTLDLVLDKAYCETNACAYHVCAFFITRFIVLHAIGMVGYTGVTFPKENGLKIESPFPELLRIVAGAGAVDATLINCADDSGPDDFTHEELISFFKGEAKFIENVLVRKLKQLNTDLRWNLDNRSLSGIKSENIMKGEKNVFKPLKPFFAKFCELQTAIKEFNSTDSIARPDPIDELFISSIHVFYEKPKEGSAAESILKFFAGLRSSRGAVMPTELAELNKILNHSTLKSKLGTKKSEVELIKFRDEAHELFKKLELKNALGSECIPTIVDAVGSLDSTDDDESFFKTIRIIFQEYISVVEFIKNSSDTYKSKLPNVLQKKGVKLQGLLRKRFYECLKIILHHHFTKEELVLSKESEAVVRLESKNPESLDEFSFLEEPIAIEVSELLNHDEDSNEDQGINEIKADKLVKNVLGQSNNQLSILQREEFTEQLIAGMIKEANKTIGSDLKASYDECLKIVKKLVSNMVHLKFTNSNKSELEDLIVKYGKNLQSFGLEKIVNVVNANYVVAVDVADIISASNPTVVPNQNFVVAEDKVMRKISKLFEIKWPIISSRELSAVNRNLKTIPHIPYLHGSKRFSIYFQKEFSPIMRTNMIDNYGLQAKFLYRIHYEGSESLKQFLQQFPPESTIGRIKDLDDYKNFIAKVTIYEEGMGSIADNDRSVALFKLFSYRQREHQSFSSWMSRLKLWSSKAYDRPVVDGSRDAVEVCSKFLWNAHPNYEEMMAKVSDIYPQLEPNGNTEELCKVATNMLQKHISVENSKKICVFQRKLGNGNRKSIEKEETKLQEINISAMNLSGILDDEEDNLQFPEETNEERKSFENFQINSINSSASKPPPGKVNSNSKSWNSISKSQRNYHSSLMKRFRDSLIGKKYNVDPKTNRLIVSEEEIKRKCPNYKGSYLDFVPTEKYRILLKEKVPRLDRHLKIPKNYVNNHSSVQLAVMDQIGDSVEAMTVSMADRNVLGEGDFHAHWNQISSIS